MTSLSTARVKHCRHVYIDNEIIPRKDKLKGSVLHIVWAAAQWPTPVAMPLDIMILRMQQEHLLLLQQS